MFNKRVLIKPIEFKGIGVHSGKETYLRLSQNSSKRDGFLFYNLKNGCGLELSLDYVINQNSTNLEKNGCKFKTIEHFLSPLYFLGFDSIKLESKNEEFPILDGSSKEIVERLLENSKIVEKRSDFFKVKSVRKIKEGDTYIEYSPFNSFFVDYTIVYNHPLIGEMNYSADIDEKKFIEEIAPARTFGFLKDAEYLKSKGLALGSNLKNTVVFDDKNLINPPLRFKDEMVRHKILDFIGDISFLKKPLLGKFKVYKGGHSLHIKLVKELLRET